MSDTEPVRISRASFHLAYQEARRRGESVDALVDQLIQLDLNGAVRKAFSDPAMDRAFEADRVSTGPRLGEHDSVNHPAHYTDGPLHSACGQPIECIDITRHFGFALGNAIKYIWRHLKKGQPTEDLKKARWYLDDHIKHGGS